jgi:hypothetical protein
LAECSRDESARRLDAISMATWLDRHGLHSEPLRWFVEYATRDDYGASLNATSAWAALHYFASRDSEERFEFPEGNGQIVYRLLQELSAEEQRPQFPTSSSGAGSSSSGAGEVEGWLRTGTLVYSIEPTAPARACKCSSRRSPLPNQVPWSTPSSPQPAAPSRASSCVTRSSRSRARCPTQRARQSARPGTSAAKLWCGRCTHAGSSTQPRSSPPRTSSEAGMRRGFESSRKRRRRRLWPVATPTCGLWPVACGLLHVACGPLPRPPARACHC